MCGIAGLIAKEPTRLQDRVSAMTKALAHRGPDGSGLWLDAAAKLALGHARLAIRDLTPTGAQPMLSASSRFVLSYNGELYNAEEMKAALPGHVFRGASDTEILLEHFARHGVESTLREANGMFALALWDREERQLLLARDRFGIKPLYWALAGGEFFFGSELKALVADKAFPRDLDEAALSSFLQLSYVPEPLSIWRAAKKLEPGALLCMRPGGQPEIERWWNPLDEIMVAKAAGGGRSVASLAEEADALLVDAVNRQTVSDAPVGVFLSGGVDSSTVASLLAARGSGQGLDCFTIGFAEGGYDESEQAAKIAAHLGLRHHERRLTAKDALAVVPKLAGVYDEPFADSSQIPAVLLSAFAKERVKVVLTGDGGDEIFAGYNRHRFALREWPYLQCLPRPFRTCLASALARLPLSAWEALGQLMGLPQAGEKAQKLLAVAGSATLEAAHACLARQGLAAWESPLATGPASPYLEPPTFSPTTSLHPLDRMQLADIRTYLPGDILTKMDRASMSVGLEARVPLLDHRLMGLAFALAPKARFEAGAGKQLLRKALGKRVPPALFEGQPKRGFAAPIDEWLKGPLADWAGDLLHSLKQDKRFDAQRIEDWRRQHNDGTAKRHHALWNLLMFESWRRAA